MRHERWRKLTFKPFFQPTASVRAVADQLSSLPLLQPNQTETDRVNVKQRQKIGKFKKSFLPSYR